MQKILLIDDNAEDVRRISEMLSESEGRYALITADRLSSGLRFLREDEFSVVLLDLDLPDNGGIDAVQQIQDIKPETTVIVLARPEDRELAEKTISLGARDYLVKGKFESAALSCSIACSMERERTEKVMRKIEAALWDSEARFRAITSTALDAVILIDNDGNVSYWNDAAARMFGYSSEEIMGRFLHDLIMPDRHITAFRKGFELFRSTGGGRFIGKVYSIDAKSKDGTEFPVELSLAATKMKGKWSAIGIVRDITQRKVMEDKIKHMAQHDALTDLANRLLFEEIVNIAIADAHRNARRIAIFFLDLDGFKGINDTLGHEAGDALLKQVAAGLRGTIRASDTVARVGGDEFTILITDIDDTAVISDIARKIMDFFKKDFLISGREVHISASIGISIFPDDAVRIDDLIRYADMAMYRAKEKGRNRFKFYNREIGGEWNGE